MSAPDDDTLRAMLEGLRCGSVHITADRCTGDSRAVGAFCDLIRAAPALAAEVLRLRTECDVLRHERDEHAHKAGEWEESHDIELARAKKAEAERDAVREDFHAMEEAFYAMQARAEAAGAIIEGRTVPPTAEEIEAHAAAGGEWLLRWPWHGPRWPWRCAAFGGAEVLIEWEEGAVCIALDRTRRPCAWPVAGGGR